MKAVPLRWLLLVPAALLLGLFFLYPIGTFLMQGFLDTEGTLTLTHVERVWAAGTYTRTMLETIKLSGWITLFSLLIAYPVAYLLANAQGRGRATLALLVLLPFWSSFLVRTFAWIVILGRQGPVNGVLMALGIVDRPVELMYGWGAVVVGMTNVLVPFAVLTMAGVMERIDRGLMVAASTLGAKPAQAFFRVYLPLSMPGVTSAALLVFISALGFFIAPALLGGAQQTMITQLVIQQVTELVNWPFAAILCLLLLGSALVLFAAFDKLVGLSSLSGETKSLGSGRFGVGMRLAALAGDVAAAFGSAFTRRPRAPGYIGKPTIFMAVVAVAFLVIPLLLLIPVSFSSKQYLSWPPGPPSLQWFGEVLSSGIWATAALRSFFVALLTTAICLVVAVPAAFAFERLKGGAASATFAAMIAPLLVPRMVIAVALFYLYARLGMVGTTVGLAIGHAVIALPYVFIALIAVLKTYDRRLDAAAASLGASPFVTARKVTLPLISGGVVAAALFAFVTSLDELNIALFASGGLQSTLPKLMWDEATLRFSPLLAAVSTLVLIVMSVLAVLAAWARGKSLKD
ncbi:ABC transporter permease subunit [Stappia sp.]|uniref:ABC transporter permease subunit n=1 Tax=Stappia sp. TaxID=1870903 RepID=UPI003A99050D